MEGDWIRGRMHGIFISIFNLHYAVFLDEIR